MKDAISLGVRHTPVGVARGSFAEVLAHGFEYRRKSADVRRLPLARWCVAEPVFDSERKRITVDRWSARTTWLRCSRSGTGMASALLGLRPNVQLLVQADEKPESVWVELWEGEPEESDGLAVVLEGEDLRGLARIPLCGCGDRGCGNVGVQPAALNPAANLPALVDLLRALPHVPGPPRKGSTWNGVVSLGTPAV